MRTTGHGNEEIDWREVLGGKESTGGLLRFELVQFVVSSLGFANNAERQPTKTYLAHMSALSSIL